MHRYYMSPETQQAVIAESNRLIARRSMTRSRDSGDPSGHSALDTGSGTGSVDSGDDSAFARLVADLQAVSGDPRSQ